MSFPPEQNERLEPAVPEDARELVTLTKACVARMRSQGIDQWDEFYPDQSVIARDIAEETLRVVRLGGRIIACLTLDEQMDPLWKDLAWSSSSGKICAIHRVMVHPDHQALGLAGRLMAQAEAMARSLGFQAVRLDCFTLNPGALRLYEKLGYRRTGVALMRKGEFAGFEKLL